METMPLGSRYENDEIAAEKRILPTHVLCASPRVAHAGTAVMDISINGFDYSGNFKFTFTEPADVYRISPQCGPTTEKTRVQLIGTGLGQNKDNILQKTGVYETNDLKSAEAKNLLWSESEYLSSMYETAQDLLTFKYIEHSLKEGDKLQSVYVNIETIPGLKQVHGGANSVSLGEEIDFTVEKNERRRL